MLYSLERIEEVLRQIEMILDDCLANPDVAVADISVSERAVRHAAALHGR